MKNIILIQPKIGYLDSINKHPSLPLGLLSVSRYISKNYNVKIIDQRLDKNWKKILLNELSKNPLFVALTVMTGPQLNHANKISHFIKKNSHAKVVWGGPHPTLFLNSIKSPLVDIIVRGEGEITINELAKTIEHNGNLKLVKGISFKINNLITHNKERPPINMDSLPLLPLNILDFNRYIYRNKGISYTIYETSRGCINNCSFCHNSINTLSTRWRGFSAENLSLRIRRLIENYGINYFYFIDDNFFADSNRVKNFCNIIEKNRYKFDWTGSGTIKKLSSYNHTFFKKLYASGCRIIHIGLESGSQRVINSMHKEKFKVNDIILLNKKLKKYNIIPYYDLLSGYYGETLNDIKKTIRLVYRLIKDNKDAQFSALHRLSIYPNTGIYNYAIRNNLIKESEMHNLGNNWENADLPWLTDKRKELLEKLYFCSLFIDNKNKLIDSHIAKTFSKLYKPIARYRMKNLYFKYMLENRLLNLPDIL